MVRGIAVPNHSRNIQGRFPAMTVFICQYCGSERPSRNSWHNHERCCNQNHNRNYKNGMLGKSGSNQFVKAKQLGLPVPKSGRKGKAGKSVPHTEETKLKLSEIAKKNGLGGVTQSRWITYNGKTLGSSYELALVKSLDENAIKWDTCKRIRYIDPFGKQRTYTPDIYLIDYDIYLDPKNDFLIRNTNPRLGFPDLEKIRLVEEQNGIRILVLNKHQLEWNTIKTLL
jgi:hypothetical protein